MKQLEVIKQLPAIFKSVNEIQVGLLIGSFARQKPNWNSDIDTSIFVSGSFEFGILKRALTDQLTDVAYVNIVNLRNKVSVYFKTCPKLEIAICYKLDELNRNFLGSEIQNSENAILFERHPDVTNIKSYLDSISNQREHLRNVAGNQKAVRDLVEKFIYEFENCSSCQLRSDGYKSYFFYNIALHTAVQLHHFALGETKFNFLPRNFTSTFLKREEQEDFRNLNGSLYLPEINGKKRRMLDYFYQNLQALNYHSSREIEDIVSFLEYIYQRDFIWNFRDIAGINHRMKPGIIFRSSSMTRYQNEPFFKRFIEDKSIVKIVDLRDPDEYELHPYSEQTLSSFKHLHLSIDPRNQDEHFIQTYHRGTPQQIAYRHFAIGHPHVFKSIFEDIDPARESFVIHCHAGKDRTGSVVALIALLCGESMGNVLKDYHASEMDTKEENLNAFLESITEFGGPREFLISCGIDANRIDYWIKNLVRND